MKSALKILTIICFCTSSGFTQGFKGKAIGEQTFNFVDKSGGNQASFFSRTPFEDVTGISNDINGSVTFNVTDIRTLTGKVTVSVASIKTGINLRDGHLKSSEWLDADSYPEISFEIIKVSDVKFLADNKLTAKVTGNFTVHGVEKEVVADATLTYLYESEQTKLRSPGDLLGVQAKFNIRLSDYNISNKLIGQKVAEIVEITVNIVGSNAK